MYCRPKQYLKLDKRLRDFEVNLFEYNQWSILKSTRQKNWLLNPSSAKEVTLQFTPNVVRNLTKKGTTMAKTGKKQSFSGVTRSGITPFIYTPENFPKIRLLKTLKLPRLEVN